MLTAAPRNAGQQLDATGALPNLGIPPSHYIIPDSDSLAATSNGEVAVEESRPKAGVCAAPCAFPGNGRPERFQRRFYDIGIRR